MLFTYKSYLISYEVRMIFQIKKLKLKGFIHCPKLQQQKRGEAKEN